MKPASSFREFARLVRSDLDRTTAHALALSPGRAPGLRLRLDTVLFKTGFQSAFLYRLSHWLFQNRLIFLARLAMWLNLVLFAADIGFSAEIGQGLLIGHTAAVVIAHRTVIGARATIEMGVLFGVRSWAPHEVGSLPRTGDNCVFCARSSVLGGVVLGDDVVVGINAAVDRDVPSGAYAGGAPLELHPGLGKRMVDRWCLIDHPSSGREGLAQEAAA
ncbi:MAG: hypothetical protein HY077_13610 [Elusimicrobia bacterium]|nr:hypothetical protein [Elusimicrobiota bacterium]